MLNAQKRCKERNGTQNTMTNTHTEQTVLFTTIANELIIGHQTEQYLLVRANGDLSVTFPTAATEKAMTIAQDQAKQFGVEYLLNREYCESTIVSDTCVTDECEGLIRIGGELVSLSARRIGEGDYRVLFSRVDTIRLHVDLAGRVKALEDELSIFKTRLAQG